MPQELIQPRTVIEVNPRQEIDLDIYGPSLYSPADDPMYRSQKVLVREQSLRRALTKLARGKGKMSARVVAEELQVRSQIKKMLPKEREVLGRVMRRLKKKKPDVALIKKVTRTLRKIAKIDRVAGQSRARKGKKLSAYLPEGIIHPLMDGAKVQEIEQGLYDHPVRSVSFEKRQDAWKEEQTNDLPAGQRNQVELPKEGAGIVFSPDFTDSAYDMDDYLETSKTATVSGKDERPEQQFNTIVDMKPSDFEIEEHTGRGHIDDYAFQPPPLIKTAGTPKNLELVIENRQAEQESVKQIDKKIRPDMLLEREQIGFPYEAGSVPRYSVEYYPGKTAQRGAIASDPSVVYDRYMQYWETKTGLGAFPENIPFVGPMITDQIKKLHAEIATLEKEWARLDEPSFLKFLDPINKWGIRRKLIQDSWKKIVESPDPEYAAATHYAVEASSYLHELKGQLKDVRKKVASQQITPIAMPDSTGKPGMHPALKTGLIVAGVAGVGYLGYKALGGGE